MNFPTLGHSITTDSCLKGNNRSPKAKSALGLFVPIENASERTSTYPGFVNPAPVLGTRSQDLASRFYLMFLNLERLLDPTSPPRKSDAIERVQKLIDVDTLVLLHVDDHNRKHDMSHHLETRYGKTGEGRLHSTVF